MKLCFMVNIKKIGGYFTVNVDSFVRKQKVIVVVRHHEVFHYILVFLGSFSCEVADTRIPQKINVSCCLFRDT